MVPAPEATASPRSLWEMQILKPCSRPTVHTLYSRDKETIFQKALWMIFMPSQVWQACLKKNIWPCDWLAFTLPSSLGQSLNSFMWLLNPVRLNPCTHLPSITLSPASFHPSSSLLNFLRVCVLLLHLSHIFPLPRTCLFLITTFICLFLFILII